MKSFRILLLTLLFAQLWLPIQPARAQSAGATLEEIGSARLQECFGLSADDAEEILDEAVDSTPTIDETSMATAPMPANPPATCLPPMTFSPPMAQKANINMWQ
ncbi:MAG: hypothetical protein U0175_22105 [Caldilineaceae bacterium]